MGLEIRDIYGGGGCSIISCDHCDEPIVDVEDANACWYGVDPSKGKGWRVYFYHKGCYSRYYQRWEDERGLELSLPMNAFMSYLLGNLRMGKKELTKAAKSARILSAIY